MRQRLVTAFDAFHDVREMNDENIALLARQDRIDIAIHRNGYSQNSRSGIFAYGTAPVQINFLGYPGTLGASFIDYIIADEMIIPKSQQKNYSENIIYLPNCYMPQDNTREVSNKAFSHKDFGLPKSGFIFCCFNNNYKISTKEFDIWMRILGKIEGSVLWLFKSNKWSAKNLRLEAENRGISSNRLIFANRLPQG